MSLANYIIICNGDIASRAAKTPADKIIAASQCATDLVCQIQLIEGNSGFSDEDAKPISDLQHYLMDNMKTLKGAKLDAKIKEMFDLLDALEDKFSGEIDVM